MQTIIDFKNHSFFEITGLEPRPDVYSLFKKITLEIIGRGHKHYSPYGIMHIARYQTMMTMKDQGEYKINNNYTSIFSRMFMREYPEYSDFFKTRNTKRWDDSKIDVLLGGENG